MNANAYGGELGAGARVGRRLHRRRASSGAARASSASPTGARTCGPGEVVSRASFALAEAEPEEVKATLAEMREQAPRGAAVGDQDLRLDLQEPRRRSAPRAARAGQLLEAAGCRGPARSAAPGSRPKHANFVENAGDGDHRRRARADGRGPPARPRALRRRARARGPGPRRGRVARRTGSSTRAAEGRSRPAGRESNPDEPSSGRYACRQTTRRPRDRSPAPPSGRRRSRAPGARRPSREAEARPGEAEAARRAPASQAPRRTAKPPGREAHRGDARRAHAPAHRPHRRPTRRGWSRPRPLRALRGGRGADLARPVLLRAILLAGAPATSSGSATPRWSRSTDVEVVGVTSGDREQIVAELDRGRPSSMTTLHVRPERDRARRGRLPDRRSRSTSTRTSRTGCGSRSPSARRR